MGTSYWKIYNIFLSKITDFDLPHMNDDELLAYCNGLLSSALIKTRKIGHDLNDRDDVICSFNIELTDTECEIIACQMVVEWVERKTNTTQIIHMFTGTKDENMASQANHMKSLMELKDKAKSTVTELIRDEKYRAWIEEE